MGQKLNADKKYSHVNPDSEIERERARPGRRFPRPCGKPARTEKFPVSVAARARREALGAA